MKILLQRVSEASVTIGGETVGAIGPGYLGETPTKAADLENTYEFAGWKAAGSDEVLTTLPAATADATYTAAFEAKDIVFLTKITAIELGSLKDGKQAVTLTFTTEVENPDKARLMHTTDLAQPFTRLADELLDITSISGGQGLYKLQVFEVDDSQPAHFFKLGVTQKADGE